MDRVWEQVVTGLGLDLTRDISPPIPAASFRGLANFEARNACKIDSSQDLPAILRANGMFPLPVENGNYVLVRGKGFHEFEPIDSPVRPFDSKLDHELTTATGMGESVFMHHAFNTGLLSEFVGIDGLWKTNEGRFFASEFSFVVGKVGPVSQKSTQVQVDGLFEGRDSIIVIEAKTREHPDFIVRQLYYPYRHWGTQGKKDVRSLFLSVDLETKVYSFWQYRFARPNDYCSIELERSARFSIREHPRDERDLDKVQPDPEIMGIPQADDVEKVCLMPLLVAQGLDTTDRLSERVGFTQRQALYYTEAAEMLGLVDRRRWGTEMMQFGLTDVGAKVVASRPDRRHEIVAEQMMRLPIMRVVFEDLKALVESGSGAGLSREDVASRINKSSRLNMTTSQRRAGTICSWFAWMSSHYGAIQVKNGRLALRSAGQSKLDSY